MSYSISTLLTRNLHDVFGENDPLRRRAAIDEIFTEDCVFYDPNKNIYRGRDEIDRIAGAIKATHPDFRFSQLPSPRRWAMADESDGYQVAPGRRRSTLGQISSLRGTAGSPRCISFSTSYPKLDVADLHAARKDVRENRRLESTILFVRYRASCSLSSRTRHRAKRCVARSIFDHLKSES
jgi:hypothetical protein